MSLRQLSIAFEYRSDQTNVVDDFYIPCLGACSEYWRAVGFFTSNGLALAAKGLSAFASNNGKMRLVASPLFEREDIESLRKGYLARDVVERAILRQIDDDVSCDPSDIVQGRLEYLAALISNNCLDVKVAFPSDIRLVRNGALYHEKIGIFLDSVGDAVAFTGSQNETFGGLVGNFESIDVYRSWDDPHKRVERKKRNFEKLWDNLTPKLTVLEFPTAARQKILKFRTSHYHRRDPESALPNSIRESPMKTPDLSPVIELRDYQKEALKAWFENSSRGILAMATGSGKTITALAATIRLLKEQATLFVLVTCPFQHLVDQWDKEARQFGFQPILAYKATSMWESHLNSQIIEFNLGLRQVVFVISTHATFVMQPMQDAIARIRGPATFIADEAHHLGAESSRTRLSGKFNFRLGLSATPERWFDDLGTSELLRYFGKTVFEFSLQDAIDKGCLCRYSYYPHLVELSEDEFDQFREQTMLIARLVSKSGFNENDKALESALRRRASILNAAEGKIPFLRNHLHSVGEIDHCLFYCDPGQIEAVLDLLGNELKVRVHRFTARESQKQRQSLLSDFASGRLQGLVAMHCLDEGVDVPSTRMAFVLASSSNPREFIQRRGRILRRAEGKENAVVHDLITIPPKEYYDDSSAAYTMERKIIERELPRLAEFAQSAENNFEARDVIWNIAKNYNLLDY